MPPCLPTMCTTVVYASLPSLHPFHCWTLFSPLPVYPFHCWTLFSASRPPPVSLLGKKKGTPSTRFTVGQEERHPPFTRFTVGLDGSLRRGIPTYPSWYPGGYPTLVYTSLPGVIYALPGASCRVWWVLWTLYVHHHVDSFTLLVPMLRRVGSPVRESGSFHLRIFSSSQGKRARNVQQTRHRKHSRTRTTGIS